MLILKGNTGKSLVVEKFFENNDNCIIIWENVAIPMIGKNIYQVSDFVSIQEVLEGINSVTEDKHFMFLIIYTNIEEYKLDSLKFMLESFEKEGRCRFGMLTCK